MLRELFARLAKIGARQAILVVLVTGSVIAGAGFGLVGTSTDDGPAASTATPTPPDPTVTARATATPTPTTVERPTETAATDGSGGAASDATPTTTRATTPTEPPNATLALSASDPPAVSNDRGTVERVAGNLTGRVNWRPGSSVTAVTLVVQTWTPGSKWREARRVTVAPDGTALAVEDALGGPARVYAAGDSAGEFDVGDDGASRSRRGYVSVTAVLFGANGTELDRTSAVDEYAFRVTNEASGGNAAPGDSGGGSGATADDGRPSLRFAADGENPTVLAVGNVAPGGSGSCRVSATNAGEADGVLRVAVASVSDEENGLTEPERAVDDSPSAGELSGALDVRLKLVDEDGATVRYLVGGESNYAAFGDMSVDSATAETSLAANRTVSLVAEWRVSETAGNEIQSDAVTFDLDFALVADDASQSRVSPAGAGSNTGGTYVKNDITSRGSSTNGVTE